MTRRSWTIKLSLCLAVLLLALCACSRRQAPAQQTLVTLDGQPVTDWMMGVNRLYPEAGFPGLPSPPAGYKPVYLTHYGRHGSRYHTERSYFDIVLQVLESAAGEGALTPLGQTVLARLDSIYPDARCRHGELTALGAQQHRGIARRMVHNFPCLFERGSRIVANSTNLERTMLSMQNFTMELKSIRPSLEISADASRAYMGFINQHSPENPMVTPADVQWKSPDAPWRPAFWEYFESLIDAEPFCSRLFSDPAYPAAVDSPFGFMYKLYSIALTTPGAFPQSRGFLELFTAGELELLGQMDNYSFYVEKSRYPGGNRRGCFLSEAVLGDIIDRTQEDIASGVSVRLRFGHDGCIMALLAMLKLEGWNAELEDPSRAWKVWDVSRIPMAANLQIVLFGKGGRAAGNDPIFFVLLNEEPLELPLEDLGGHFYRWSDFVDYCSPILDEARAALEQTIIFG